MYLVRLSYMSAHPIRTIRLAARAPFLDYPHLNRRIMKNKKLAKKPAKKAAKKSPARKQPKPQERTTKAEIIVHIDQSPHVPTVTDLAEPMRDGKKLTIPKTWLSEGQLLRMLQRTPREQVYRRKGRGKDEFDYVTGSYCVKWLNFVFGWNWDWEVTSHGTNKAETQIWALGKLTVRGTHPGQIIVKTAFGRSEVKQLKTGGDLDYGNDLKAASTDAMKKAASLLGFASDIYGKADYKMESGQDALPPADPRPVGAAQVSPEEPSVQLGAPKICTADVGHGAVHGIEISEQEADFSLRMFGKELCRAHQNQIKPRGR